MKTTIAAKFGGFFRNFSGRPQGFFRSAAYDRLYLPEPRETYCETGQESKNLWELGVLAMQTMKCKGPRTAAAVLVLAALEMVTTIEALGQEQPPEITQALEYRLLSAEWAGELPDESLKIALLEWIGANSDYDASEILTNPPEVRFCEHGSTLVYGGKAIHFDDRLNGVYDEATKQICLAKPWHASNVKDRGVLLHELVHHVQFEGKSWLCPKATEWEAYKLQEAWLFENGMRPDFNWVYILLDSSCAPRDVHP